MWTKTLRQNTNLSPQLVARALKNLEQRLLVKSVKSVQNATKKLYMLHDLEPAKEHDRRGLVRAQALCSPHVLYEAALFDATRPRLRCAQCMADQIRFD